MTRWYKYIIVFLILINSSFTGSAVPQTIYPTNMSEIRNNGVNNYTSTQMGFGYFGTSYIVRTLLNTSLISDSNITLTVYITGVGDVNINSYAYNITQAWTPSSVTWANQPTVGGLLDSDLYVGPGWYTYDLGIKNIPYGIEMRGEEANDYSTWDSITIYNPTYKPYFTYTYPYVSLTSPSNTTSINIELPSTATSTTFRWTSTSPQYRFVLGQDSISNEVINTTIGVNYSVQMLAVGHTYYWKVQNVDENSTWTSTYQYTVNSIPVQGRLNITAFDEKTWGSRILTFNATVYNNTFSTSKATSNGWANFSGSEIGQGEYFITITPNSSYAPRSQLANSPGNVTFYLPPTTSTINTIQFYLLDYSGLYPWDSSVFKIYRNNTLMQSSYFDADAKVGAYLINGDSYQLQVTNGANIYQWGNFMPMASGSINLVILDTGFNKTKYNPFDYNITWTNASITASWLDHGTLVSPGINLTIYKGTTKTQVHTLVTTQPSGTSEYTVTNHSDIYYISFTATTTNGNVQKYFVIDYRAGQIKGGGMNDSVNATGYTWDYGTFVMPAWVYNAVAWVLLLLLAGSSGYIHSGFMSIVTGVFAVLFWFVGWLDLGGVGPGLLGGIVLIIIISYFKEKEHTT